jgi:hypothetical protein
MAFPVDCQTVFLQSENRNYFDAPQLDENAPFANAIHVQPIYEADLNPIPFMAKTGITRHA